MRKDNNNNKASIVSPNICRWFYTPSSTQASSRYESRKTEITFHWLEQTELQICQSSHHLGLYEAGKYSLEHKLFPLATKATPLGPRMLVDARYLLNKTNVCIIAKERKWNWYLYANPSPPKSSSSGFSESLIPEMAQKSRRQAEDQLLNGINSKWFHQLLGRPSTECACL